MMISDHLYKQYKENWENFFDYDDLISRGEIKIFSKSELKEYLQNWKKEIEQKTELTALIEELTKKYNQ